MKLCMGCMEEMEDNLVACPHCGFNEITLRQESYYLDPGTVIGGKYIVGRVLSYGGHAVSYLGMDAEANRKVIVREYLPSDFSTRSEGEKEVTIYSGDAQRQFEQGLTNFLNEANKIQTLGNPEGISIVYDCVAENDTGYVISEYLKGRTLKEILSSGRRYSAEEAAVFISRILRGLSRVHPLDIIHCDISPETIMVTDAGEIKLLDFGATRYVTTANSKSLAIILQQGYAPEEQYRSSGKRGPWTDVYALGAVMYRMITGITPQESVERTLSDELKEPSKLGITIPANVENALMNALNVYQTERTPSAEAFLRELNSPSVKRIKAAKRKKETGKFPVWAKGLVAALLCIVAVGGVVVWDNWKKDGSEDLKNEVLLADFTGKECGQVKDWIEANKESVEVTTETVYLYNKDDSKNETVVEQSVPSGSLFEGKDGVTRKSGKYHIDLTLCVFSDQKTSCRDIRGLRMNASLLMGKFGDAEVYDPVSEGGDENSYYDILSVEYEDELGDTRMLEKDDIEKTETNINIEIDKIKKIRYYAGKFFCWEADELDNFEGRSIVEIPAQSIYTKDITETEKKVPAGEKSLKDSNLVDSNYYTNDGRCKAGTIVEQTVDKGSPLDLSKVEDQKKLDNGVLLKVIGKLIAPNSGESIDDLKKRLETEKKENGEKKYPFYEVWVVDEDETDKELDTWEDKELTGETRVEKRNGVLSYYKGKDTQIVYFNEEEMKEIIYKIIVRDKPKTSAAPKNKNPKSSENKTTEKGF